MKRPFVVPALAIALTTACGTGDAGDDSRDTTALTTPSTTPVTAAVLDGPLLPAAGLFERISNPPAIPHGSAQAWNDVFTDPGAALVHEGSVYVFQNGFPRWPGPVGVGLWRSDDIGTTWIEVSAEPVFDGSDLDYVGVAALASSALVLDDGTWVLYFYTWDDPTWPDAGSSIGRATAPSPSGPWTADPEPVLRPGPPGAWDSRAVRVPSVVVDGEGLFHMWFTGVGNDVAAIGYATSTDGITWNKHDDPTTSDLAHAVSDPVFVASTVGWDVNNVHQPRVVVSPDGFVMAYTAVNTTTASNVEQAHGLAVSSNGIDWERSDGPVVSAGDVGARKIWFTGLVWTANTYVMLLEVGAGGETNIYTAVHRGSVRSAS